MEVPQDHKPRKLHCETEMESRSSGREADRVIIAMSLLFFLQARILSCFIFEFDFAME